MASVGSCCICGKIVRLEDCKIEERGSPVHESCYVANLISKKATLSTDILRQRKAIPDLVREPKQHSPARIPRNAFLR